VRRRISSHAHLTAASVAGATELQSVSPADTQRLLLASTEPLLERLATDTSEATEAAEAMRSELDSEMTRVLSGGASLHAFELHELTSEACVRRT